MCARATRFGANLCLARLMSPDRVCTLECTALPITWMGPGLAAGIGGPSRAARATTGAKVRLPPPPTGATARQPDVSSAPSHTCVLCSLCAGDVRHRRPHRCCHRRPRISAASTASAAAFGRWCLAVCVRVLCAMSVCRWRVRRDCGRPRAGRKAAGCGLFACPARVGPGRDGTAGAAGTLRHALGAV